MLQVKGDEHQQQTGQNTGDFYTFTLLHFHTVTLLHFHLGQTKGNFYTFTCWLKVQVIFSQLLHYETKER